MFAEIAFEGGGIVQKFGGGCIQTVDAIVMSGEGVEGGGIDAIGVRIRGDEGILLRLLSPLSSSETWMDDLL